MLELRLEGVDEALEALNLDIPGQLGLHIEGLVKVGALHGASITPVVTGAMRAAWRWARSGLEGVVEIDPSAVNPLSGVLVSEYAPIVSERLGILNGVIEKVRPLVGADLEFW